MVIISFSDEDSSDTDDSSECSNYDEKRDRFIARLYNFHDEKGMQFKVMCKKFF